MTHSTTAVKENREALGRAEAHIGVIELEIGKHVQTTGALDVEIAALRAELKSRVEILLNYEKEVDDLACAFADLSRSHMSLRQNYDTALKTARIEKRKSEAALAKANARINMIVNSRSMKVTAFLRRLGSFVAKK